MILSQLGNRYMDYLIFFKEINAQKQINILAKKYKNKKIVIYGAGIMARVLFENFDLSNLNILFVCDKKFSNKSEKFYSYNTIPPNELKNIDFDVLLIILRDEKVVDYLSNTFLMNTKNENKIICKMLKIPLSYYIKYILF